VQAVVLPIADRHLPYAADVRDRLATAGLRVELDERQEKIGYKIREAQLQKIPYMLVVGDREAEQGTVSVRGRADGDIGAWLVADFVGWAGREVESKGRETVRTLSSGAGQPHAESSRR
jgi:threonyl-tRNA synthetase